MTTGATIQCGRALARNGAVTMDSNDVSFDSEGCAENSGIEIPEPSGAALLVLTALPALRWLRKVRNIHV